MARSIKHNGNRRFDGSDPAWTNDRRPIESLLKGLRHVRASVETREHDLQQMLEDQADQPE